MINGSAEVNDLSNQRFSERTHNTKVTVELPFPPIPNHGLGSTTEYPSLETSSVHDIINFFFELFLFFCLLVPFFSVCF